MLVYLAQITISHVSHVHFIHRTFQNVKQARYFQTNMCYKFLDVSGRIRDTTFCVRCQNPIRIGRQQYIY
jgi:hypothetical protein